MSDGEAATGGDPPASKKVVTVLWVDDAPPRVIRDDKHRYVCTSLTGAQPEHAYLEAYGEIVVVAREGTAKLARDLARRYEAVVADGVTVRTTVGMPHDLTSRVSNEDDFSLARRFLAEHRFALKYVVDIGRWITWSGKVWSGLYDAVGSDRAKAMLQRFLAHVGLERADTMIKAAAEDPKGTDETRKRAYAEAGKAEAGYRTTKRLNAVWSSVEVMASDSPATTVRQVDLNRSAWLLNCESGMIDLHDGKLYQWDPDELMTAICPVSYDPRVAPLAPTFQRFLSQAQPSADVRGYLQRRSGLCAYGAQRTHVFPIDLGNDGRNGKSLFAQILMHVLGEYAGTARSEILLVTRAERHLTQIASMVHKRFIAIDETRASRSLDGAQVKGMSGGMPLRSNFMRSDEFTYTPAFTMVLSSNELPKFEGSDRALGARLQITPWEISFHGKEDEDLLDKIKAEAEAVLHWIVAGAIEYLARGLQPPEAVTELTKEERVEHDPIGKWLEEHLIEMPGGIVYTDWLHEQATTMGWPDLGARPFAMRLSSWLGEQSWGAKKVQPMVDGKRWRGWEGVGFK